MTTNLQIKLTARPSGAFDPSATFTTSTAPIPTTLEPGQLLIETLYLSLEPISRKWMEPHNYMQHIELGDTMVGISLGRILASRSDNPALQPGALVTAWTGWQTHAVITEDGVLAPVETKDKAIHPTDALGVLGGTGTTAYFATLATGAKPPAPGETVLVSAAAGATGSVAAQLAKIRGARVVGIAGGEAKCKWLTEELGLDAVVDYKRGEDFEQQLKEAVPDGIDLYFDNVGGKTLELAIEHLNHFGRIIIVGDLSGYNTSTPQGIKSLFPIAAKAASIYGFNIFDHMKDPDAMGKAVSELSGWLREGKLNRTETIVKGGLEAAPQALSDLFAGKNTGKMLVEIKPVEI